ncbi:Gfo/Idh/MocA family oxidoreductase [Streptomyces tubbatahanensis]|uniref:Gfo/Idh/MocA family oxidoreductase n=1 Tax=Streptomyces tubbatahanensis TaxID=2923272 RepID=A0ABY3XYU0_9ACTN|nr:Gfo/Idh/MocA family oxidoreductase [Streptomyces tubbatahanensis]UNS99516.1 Gfo/Idh/MocA family oxidoreductase [Streptomyces tubbatahanensis]
MRLGLIGTGRIGAFHAATLRSLAGVDRVTVADADAGRARALAASLELECAGGIEELYAAGLDGVVITAATSAHATLIHQALDHEVPVFCEKPVAPDVPGTVAVVERAASGTVPVQIGFQRRFDAGYLAARQALRSGELGWVHTLRACTSDMVPPPASYVPTSGGLFRDCGIHDFDILRWVTGREVVSVFAAGANKGEDFFAAGDDVDTCAALLRFDDDTLATATATRYNGAGYDVRLEVCGSRDTRIVGLDDRAPLPSAEPGRPGPHPTGPDQAGAQGTGPGANAVAPGPAGERGTPYATFLERFHDAYVAELAAFVDVAAGRAANPCPAAEALEALYVAEACDTSRRTGLPVAVSDVRSRRAPGAGVTGSSR